MVPVKIRNKYVSKILQAIGVVGTLVCVGLFVAEPSFPTPDKLIIFLVFVFMIFHQAEAMLKRLLPFVAGILIYESFRGVAHQLNTHVNYSLAPKIDKFMFGGHLPTASLQQWLWHGHAQWYDYVLYFPYLLFFVVPLAMAILIWKTRDHYYWTAITAYMSLLFSAFVTFLIFPAAPPWMASDKGYIEHIHRISSDVWFGLGIKDFPSVYNHIAPNPVAAVPSLHAAVAVLMSILVFKLYGRRWGALSLAYPLINMFGIVYQGEHYVFDVLLGIIYAFAAFYAAPSILKFVENAWTKLMNSSNTKNALRSARQLRHTSSSTARRGSAGKN